MPTVKLIGLYIVKQDPDVTLVELSIDEKATKIDIGKFTQKIKGVPKLDWQAPIQEKYLDKKGEKVIGDDFDLPKRIGITTRLTFFIYFLDTSKPLVTPYGHLALIEKSKMPKRLKGIIKFEDPE